MTENQEIARLLDYIRIRLSEMRSEYKALMDGETDNRGSLRSQLQANSEREDLAA